MKNWEEEVKGLLKAELARRGISYIELAKRLEAVDVHESPENLNNKINRGKFSAVFLVQCMKALEIRVIRLDD